MNQRILILGARGFLGSYLVKYAPSDAHVILSARDKQYLPDSFDFVALDVLKKDELVEGISKIKPDVVINCVAISLPDYAEDHKEGTYAVNVTGTSNIIAACEAIGAKLIHLSTDYVFEGVDGNYNEDHPTNPVNYYGQTKVMAEELVLKAKIPFLICRTAVLYGMTEPHHRGELFFSYYNLLKNGEPIKATKQIASVTLVDNLAKAIFMMLNFQESGIYHTAGSKQISRYEFAILLAQTFGFNVKLIEQVEYRPKRAVRPKNSGLLVNKLEEDFGIEFPPIEVNFQWLKNQIE